MTLEKMVAILIIVQFIQGLSRYRLPKLWAIEGSGCHSLSMLLSLLLSLFLSFSPVFPFIPPHASAYHISLSPSQLSSPLSHLLSSCIFLLLFPSVLPLSVLKRYSSGVMIATSKCKLHEFKSHSCHY